MLVSKKKLLLGIPVAIISLELFFGIIAGYSIGKFFAGKKTGVPGRGRSLIFKIGNYKIYIHHWLYCSGILISFICFNFFPISAQFSFAFLGGAIMQGVGYSDWHKIVERLN